MKAKQVLLITLVVLLSVTLLFGGPIHSSLHLDGHGMDMDEDGACQVCDLVLVAVAVELPAAKAHLQDWIATSLAPKDPTLAQILLPASPRAPPA